VRYNQYKNYRKIYIDMYILLYSIVISAFILGVYQYVDSINRDIESQPYDVSKDLFTIHNIMIYMAIVSGVFFIMYMTFSDDPDIFTSLGLYDNDVNSGYGGYEIKKTSVSPSVLRNITDPMKMGFEPYNSGGSDGSEGSEGGDGSNYVSESGTDASSVSSSECSVDSE